MISYVWFQPTNSTYIVPRIDRHFPRIRKLLLLQIPIECGSTASQNSNRTATAGRMKQKVRTQRISDYNKSIFVGSSRSNNKLSHRKASTTLTNLLTLFHCPLAPNHNSNHVPLDHLHLDGGNVLERLGLEAKQLARRPSDRCLFPPRLCQTLQSPSQCRWLWSSMVSLAARRRTPYQARHFQRHTASLVQHESY